MMEDCRLCGGSCIGGCEKIPLKANEERSSFSERFRARVDELFSDKLTSTIAGQIEAHGNQNVRLQDLFDAKRKLDRFDKIYFIASPYIPDDCYGVIYVRPEDMPNQKEKP